MDPEAQQQVIHTNASPRSDSLGGASPWTEIYSDLAVNEFDGPKRQHSANSKANSNRRLRSQRSAEESEPQSVISVMMAPYEGRQKRRVNSNKNLLNHRHNSASMIETLAAPYEPKDVDMDEQSAMTMDSPYGQDALIAGMERTFFAAVNNAWLLVIAGVGLMSVGHNDQSAVKSGVFIFGAGIIMAMLACAFHVLRVAQLKLNIAFPLGHSAAWALLVTGLTFAALVLELYFALQYPYLERSAVVRIETETQAPSDV